MDYFILGVLLLVCKWQKWWNLILFFHYSEVKKISKSLIKKLSLFTLRTCLVTKLNFFFPGGFKWSFLPIKWIFVSISIRIPKIEFQRFIKLAILRKDFFFVYHLEYSFLNSSPQHLSFQSDWSYWSRTKTNRIFHFLCSMI